MIKPLFRVVASLAFALCLVPAPAEAEAIYAVTTANVLLTFDSATPGTIGSSVAITGLVGGDAIVAIDLRPATGQLYALSSGSRLYLINPATGAATQVGLDGSFALSGGAFGFDFNPTVDLIRVVSDTEQNLRLNPTTGALAFTDTALAFAAADPNVGANPAVTGSAYTNNFSGASTTTLYGIDSGVNILVTQAPPNTGTLNTVGLVGAIVTSAVGFDISGVTGTAYASLSQGASLNPFYTINLATGAATLIGNITSAVQIVDITVGVQGVPVTPTATVTGTPPTATATRTSTPTATATATSTATVTGTPAPTLTATATSTATVTGTPAPTLTATATVTPSTTPNRTLTAAAGGGISPAQVPTLSGRALLLMALAIGAAGYVLIRSFSSNA